MLKPRRRIERPFRSYTIERDSDGLPNRMIWNGDYVRASVTFTACPKCDSRRIVDNRCLNCWHDARNEFWRELTDAEYNERVERSIKK